MTGIGGIGPSSAPFKPTNEPMQKAPSSSQIPLNEIFIDTNSSGPTDPDKSELYCTIPTREMTPVWVFDRSEEYTKTPHLYRSTSNLDNLDDSFNKQGLAALHASASGSIASPEQVEEICKLAKDSEMSFFDLRQETHALSDTLGLTLRGKRDWANLGLSRQEVLAEEANQVSKLRGQDKISLISAQDLKADVDNPEPLILHKPKLFSEKEAVENAGASYHRINVTDHLRPSRPAVDSFIQAVRDLPQDSAVHFHCCGGRGRTTTFMAMYDMLYNAKDVPFEDIINRQEKFNIDYNLTPEKIVNPEKAKVQTERSEYLQEFHNYAKHNPKGKPQLWSEWRTSASQEKQP